MQVNSSILSKLTIAGRICFIYYHGQPRTCFSCGESGHQKRDCPRTSIRAEAISALARSSTWGSQALNTANTTDVTPLGDSSLNLDEQPPNTPEGLNPDLASTPGQTVTEHTSTRGDAQMTVPFNPTGLASEQHSAAELVLTHEPMDDTPPGDGITLSPGSDPITLDATLTATVVASGEQSATEIILPLALLDSPPAAGDAIIPPGMMCPHCWWYSTRHKMPLPS